MILAVGSELLDLGPVNAGLVERRANRADIGRLGELDLHQRTAGELDAVVGRLDRQRAEPEDDESDGDPDRPLPPADEIVVGVVKNAKHQMLSVLGVVRAIEPDHVEGADDEDRGDQSKRRYRREA